MYIQHNHILETNTIKQNIHKRKYHTYIYKRKKGQKQIRLFDHCNIKYRTLDKKKIKKYKNHSPKDDVQNFKGFYLAFSLRLSIQ